MADTFDRARYTARLNTRQAGVRLLVRETTASTNDDAWEAMATLGDGAAVIALAQTAGRGRAGRSWSHAPGKGLALSVALRLGCDVRQAGVIPLAAGLAVTQAAHALGVKSARLKWPNDVLVGGAKLAGVLCEVRRAPGGGDAVVIGIGLNVAHTAADFPAELAGLATSLQMSGAEVTLEDAAAEVLNRLEPLWNELQEGDRGAVLAEWTRWGAHWGQWITVRTPSGPVEGTAVRLDTDGGLVLKLAEGPETIVIAGDVHTSAQDSSTEGCDVA